MYPEKNKEKEPLERLRIWYGVSDLKQKINWLGTEPSTKNHITDSESNQRWFEQLSQRGPASSLTARSSTSYCLDPKERYICLRFTGKTIKKDFEVSPINGFEPALHEKAECQSRTNYAPKEIFKRNRCASGWTDIYEHSTNPVNIRKMETFGTHKQSLIASHGGMLAVMRQFLSFLDHFDPFLAK